MKKVITVVAVAALCINSASVAAGDAAAGKSKAATCGACHGANGISPNDLWPNLAGQKADGSPVIGAAHAGWRGALGGVLDETVTAMGGLGTRRETIRAAIGPCIGQASYEVGPEFPGPFLEEDPGNKRFFAPGVRDGHPMFDIAGYVEARMRGLEIADVGRVEADTCAEPERFFSYRRKTLTGEPDYGRQLSAIVIEP